MKSVFYHSTAGIAAVLMATSAGTAWAQDADDNEGATIAAGEIIVTARRTEERLQDVPISMTVYNQEQLTQRNIAVATDLATYTPSLQVNQRFGPEKASFSLRGFNQDMSTAPTVGVYFAEVVGVRAQGGTTSGNTVGAGSFTDLANVQVLKGPQGTLFGRNTTGGAILLTPQKPTDRLEGFVEGTYGNYDQMRLTAAVNLPLSDTFRVRAAFERNKRDGYMENLSGIGPKDYNDVNYWYGRLSIVGDLTPDLENYTIFHISRSDTRGYASRITGCATPTSPQGPLNTVVGTPGYSGTRHLQAASCQIQLALQNARGDSLYQFETRNQIRSWKSNSGR
jgi:iron complex outermembrane recepter protein